MGTPQEARRLMKLLDRKHVEAAIARINMGDKGAFAQSTKYDLIYRGQPYPPKRVVGLGLNEMSGNQFTPYDFKGGELSLCFRTLKRLEYSLQDKDGNEYTSGGDGPLTRDVVYEAVKTLGGRASASDVRQYVKQNHSAVPVSNVTPDLQLLTVNDPSRGHHHRNKEPRRTDTGSPFDLLYKVGKGRDGKYVLYDPAVHGVWELAKVSGRDILMPHRISGGQDEESVPRNPDWTRDELILALDLYLREPKARGSKTHPACRALSETLNKLPIHTGHVKAGSFRNADGVGMKLSNFLRFDPGYTGKGLPAGSGLEKEVWDTYATDPAKLQAAVERILGAGRELTANLFPPLADADDEADEGQVITKLHRYRERDPKITKNKKKEVLARTGTLQCEVCSFDFKVKYGPLGEGFAECHHGKPLSKLQPGEKTKIADLHIVCANCHRMLHKGRQWRTVAELRTLVFTKG